MKKKKKCGCGFLKAFLCLTGIGVVLCFLLKDKIKDKFFNAKYEDAIFKVMDVARLATDLLMWPVDYIRAILP